MKSVEKQNQVVGDLNAIIRNDAGLYEGDLRYYFKILFNNASNTFNPYHNFRHITHFLWLCFDAINFYLEDGLTKTKKEIRELLIAAMFHDFDHTGVAGPDVINIERAVSALRRYCHPDDRSSIDIMEFFIRLSEYPHKIPSEEIDIFAQIMRDADMAQSLSLAWIQQVIFGLAAEKGVAPIEMLKSQDSFLCNLKFTTEWAKQRFPDEVLEMKIREVRELIELLE